MSASKKIFDLDVDRLHEVLDYDPETGELTWRFRTSPTCKLGVPAGRIGADGYRCVGLDGKSYKAHQLAWLHFYSAPPEKEIDFINGKKDDLRISNMRLATRAENSRNMKRPSTNTTGYKGVAVFNSDRNLKKYRAQIRVNNKRIHLGNFSTPEEAHEAYRKAAEKYHGKFARTK